MRQFSLFTIVTASVGFACSALPSHAQQLDELLKANPQASALLRGISAKVVGGDPVEIKDNPWQVALVRGLDAEPTRSQFCGGSLIAPQWVLTAAHCIRNTIVREQPGRINVVVGTKQFFVGGERLQVSSIHVHPKYVDQTHDFDFALLRLNKPVTTGGGAIVDPVEIASAQTDIPAGTKAFVSGWGAVSEGGPGSLELLGVEIPIVSNAVCNRPESYAGDITENMLCGGRDKGGIDSCQGDSGGPLTADISGKKLLIGVVSFGEGCARKLKFGVYARVPVAANFIASTMAANK
jgi:trypsin